MNCISNFISDILINILAAVLFLLIYEMFIKRLLVFCKYYKLTGYYLVCSQNGKVYCNSPELIPNFLKIDISFWNPNVLITISKDFDKVYSNKWKTWTGKIVMNELTDDYGSGYYIYEEGTEPGIHEIFVKDRNKSEILVRITDYGRANLKEHRDNVSVLQNWRKVNSRDKQIIQFKKLL